MYSSGSMRHYIYVEICNGDIYLLNAFIYWMDAYLLNGYLFIETCNSDICLLNALIFIYGMHWYLSIECTQLPYYPHIFFGCSGTTQNSMHLYKSPVVEIGRFRHTSRPSRVWIFLYLFPTKHTSLSFTRTHALTRVCSWSPSLVCSLLCN